MLTKNNISVCICTYKRPEFLANLLKKLELQKTENLFSYSIIIVDNDYRGTAKNIVIFDSLERKITIDYFIEPKQNISLARNKAVQNSKGDLIAFIDDDEFPEKDWLLNLFKSYKDFNVSGVIGPVLSFFETEPPDWIKKGTFYNWVSYGTGRILKWNEARSGNFLIKKDIFDTPDNYFDISFGKTGGEDTDFFKRMIEKGHKFVWCSEAIVYENIGSERWRPKWILRRALRTGALYGKIRIKNKTFYYKVLFVSEIIRNLFLIILIIPFSWISGLNIFWEYAYKFFSNIGKLLGLFGFVVKGYESTK
jgi:glycosyltransferase involved in cell wall biosynthesis